MHPKTKGRMKKLSFFHTPFAVFFWISMCQTPVFMKVVFFLAICYNYSIYIYTFSGQKVKGERHEVY